MRSSRWRRRRPSGRHPSSKPSDNAASPSTASLRRPVPEIYIACHPSSSCNPCQIPQKRGPARAKRSGQTHETAWSSWPFADSIEEVVSYGRPLCVEGRKTSSCRLFWNRTCLHHGAPLLWQPLPRVCRILPSWAEEPGSPESSGHGKSQAGPAGKARRHHADACTILGQMDQKKRHMQVSSLTERLCKTPDGICSLPHPDLQAPGLHVRNFAQSILSACSVCRPISPDSMASGKPVLGMMQIPYLRLLPRFIETKDMLHIYTDRHCQPMLCFDICACPSPVMISCSE